MLYLLIHINFQIRIIYTIFICFSWLDNYEHNKNITNLQLISIICTNVLSNETLFLMHTIIIRILLKKSFYPVRFLKYSTWYLINKENFRRGTMNVISGSTNSIVWVKIKTYSKFILIKRLCWTHIKNSVKMVKDYFTNRDREFTHHCILNIYTFFKISSNQFAYPSMVSTLTLYWHT